MSYWVAGATVVSGVAGAAASSSAAGNAANAQVGASQDAIAAQQAALRQQQQMLSPFLNTGTLANTKLQTLLGLGGTPGGDQTWEQLTAPGLAKLATEYAGENPYGDDYQDARTQLYQQAQSQYLNQVDSNDPSYGSLVSPITMANIQADPVYASGLDFGLNQGAKSINNAALAGGGYNSGATLKALSKFANDYGTTKAQAGANDIMAQRNQTYGMLSGQQGVGLSAAGQSNSATQNAANNTSGLLTGIGNANAAGIVGSANAYSGIGQSIGNAYNSYNNNQLLSSLVNNQWSSGNANNIGLNAISGAGAGGQNFNYILGE